MSNGNVAATEMERLRHASAWSPVHAYANRKRNQFVSRYTFSDGSILRVYVNGDASWQVQGIGEQRWRAWHSCNTQGKPGIPMRNMRDFDRL